MRKMQTQMIRGQRGFTIIELLVVTGIIGIIAAIAIPQYAGYKSRGVDSQMESALKNARTAMEAYYIQLANYPTDATDLFDYGYNPTAGLTLAVVPPVTETSYRLCSCAEGGTTPCYEFNTVIGVTLPASLDCP